MGKTIDLTGKRFGRLVVVKEHEGPRYGTRRGPRWDCLCDCGNTAVVHGIELRRGETRSCGCLHSEIVSNLGRKSAKHGGYQDRLHGVWTGMLSRCNNRNAPPYKNYGGRGISVCEEWKSYSNFKKWAYKNGYDEKAERGVCTIDRIDVNGDYEPKNCRFISAHEQCFNMRTNNRITALGQTHCIAKWAEKIGVTPGAIQRVIRNGHINPTKYIEYKLAHPNEKRTKREKIMEWDAP